MVITDQGPGIPQEQLKTLFDFTPSTKIDGSGVGLQAIASIAREHNAAITVTSEVGVGTTFTVTFPSLDQPSALYVKPEEPTDYIGPYPIDDEPTIIPSTTPQNLGKKVLLLDDEEILREGIADRLESLNFEVITAEDGQQGLALVDTHALDCILLDLNMPIMDGRRFMEVLNHSQKGKSIPVLICSSEIGLNLNDEFAHYPNFKGVIEKLIPLEELNGHILTAMGDSQ